MESCTILAQFGTSSYQNWNISVLREETEQRQKREETEKKRARRTNKGDLDMDMNCGMCFYGRKAPEGLLVCVKRAPFHGDEMGDRGVWPTVLHGDYCGDWKSALDTTPQRTVPDAELPADRLFVCHRDDVEFLAAIFQYPDLRDRAALALDVDTLPEMPVTEALKAFLVATTEQFDEELKAITNTDTQHLIARAASEEPIPKDRAAEVVSCRVTAMVHDGLRRDAEGLLVEIELADKNKEWDELRQLQKRHAELVRRRYGLSAH